MAETPHDHPYRREDYDIALYAPTVPAENVPLEALLATRSYSGIQYATSLIEQSFITGESHYLDQADGVLASTRHDTGKAQLFLACHSWFAARTAHRLPTTGEAATTHANIRSAISYHLEILTPAGTEQVMPSDFHGPERAVVNDAIGSGGETVAMDIAAYGYAHGLIKKPIMLSSYREDTPRGSEMVREYRQYTHDMHTYNPEYPADRQTIVVKTSRKPAHRRARADVRFNVLQQTRYAIATVDGIKPGDITLPTISDALELGYDVDSPHGRAAAIWRVLGGNFQRMLEQAG